MPELIIAHSLATGLITTGLLWGIIMAPLKVELRKITGKEKFAAILSRYRAMRKNRLIGILFIVAGVLVMTALGVASDPLIVGRYPKHPNLQQWSWTIVAGIIFFPSLFIWPGINRFFRCLLKAALSK